MCGVQATWGRSGVKSYRPMKTEINQLLADLRTCRNKIRYSTCIDADLGIATLWANKQRDLIKYECKWCYGWHLTHGKWKVWM